MDALHRAIGLLGGQAALARACGVSQPTVWYWIKRGRVPAERVKAIEAATGGRVTAAELRPDIFAPPPRRNSKRSAA